MAEQDPAQRTREVGDQASKQQDAAQESAQDLAANVQNQAQDASDTLSDAGQDANAPDRVRQFAQDAQQQAQALTEEGLAKLRVTAEKASGGVDQAAHAAGGTLRSAASGVRSYAPESGSAADLTERLASKLEQSGAYLEEQSGIVADMFEFARRHPLAITLAGGGILLLLARSRRRG